MFNKLGALLDRVSSKRSTTRPNSKPRTSARTLTRAFSHSGATATPSRALPATPATVASAPSTTLVFPLSPCPNDVLDTRAHVLSPGTRRVRFTSGSSVCTTHSKEEYDRSPIVDTPAGAAHEGTRSPNKLRRARERAPRAQRQETFPASVSSPNLGSASPERRGAANSKRERRPSLLMQSGSRSFVAMAIAEEESPLVSMTRSKAEGGQLRSRPKPRTRPSVDSARAICGGIVGRGVKGPYAFADDEEIPFRPLPPLPQPPAPTAIDHPVGESFLSLDYSDDEDIDDNTHTTMFVHGRRASDRTQRVADALFFTLAPGNDNEQEHWETYGAAQTEGKRDRARGQRETRALLAAFPEPPTTTPAPVRARKHRDITQWVKDSAGAGCESASSSELGHDMSASPLSWRHQASDASTGHTTPEGTPPRSRGKRGLPPYDVRTPPAKSCPALVAVPGAGRRGGDKLLPLVPYNALEQPFRYERHPYASPALTAERW